MPCLCEVKLLFILLPFQLKMLLLTLARTTPKSVRLPLTTAFILLF